MTPHKNSISQLTYFTGFLKRNQTPDNRTYPLQLDKQRNSIVTLEWKKLDSKIPWLRVWSKSYNSFQLSPWQKTSGHLFLKLYNFCKPPFMWVICYFCKVLFFQIVPRGTFSFGCRFCWIHLFYSAERSVRRRFVRIEI